MSRREGVPVLGFVLGLLVCAPAPAQEPSEKAKGYLGGPTLAVFARPTRVECFRIDWGGEVGTKSDQEYVSGYKITAAGKKQGKDFAQKIVTLLQEEKSLLRKVNKLEARFFLSHALRIWNGKASVDVLIRFEKNLVLLITRDESGKPVKSGAASVEQGIPYLLGGVDGEKLAKLFQAVLPDPRPAKVVKSWGASFREKTDEPLMKEAPKDGFITDQKAWAKLWNSWRGKEAPPSVDFDAETVQKEAVPSVDFEKQLVIVEVEKPGYFGMEFGLSVDDKGDILKGKTSLTAAGSDFGFVYLILVVDRSGIKSYKGKALK